MTPLVVRRARHAFRVTVAIAVLWASVPLTGMAFGAGLWTLAAVAAAQAVGAGLFILPVPRLWRVGAAILLVGLAANIVRHLTDGAFVGHLLVYATGTFYLFALGDDAAVQRP